MNELSRTDEDRLSFELDEGFKKWQMEQAIASFDEFGITLPLDTSSAAWRRDYADRWKFTPAPVVRPPRDWSEYLIWASTIGIIVVCAALIWSELA